MKKLLIISFFFFSLIYSQENRINRSHIVMKDGLFYDLNEFFVTDTPPPYSGKVVTILQVEDLDFGNYVRMEYYILNGKKHGNHKEWYKSGILEHEKTYKNGKQDGPYKTYFKNGQLRHEGTYKDGKQDGPYKIYYENGQINIEGNMKDGELDGVWVEFGNNGKIISKKTYENGKTKGNSNGPRKW